MFLCSDHLSGTHTIWVHHQAPPWNIATRPSAVCDSVRRRPPLCREQVPLPEQRPQQPAVGGRWLEESIAGNVKDTLWVFMVIALLIITGVYRTLKAVASDVIRRLKGLLACFCRCAHIFISRGCSICY